MRPPPPPPERGAPHGQATHPGPTRNQILSDMGAPLSPPVPQADAAYEVLHLFYSPFARCYNRFSEIGWIPGQVLARVVPGWRAVECPVCQEPLGARCPDWVTPLDDCHSHAGWHLCSWHHFSRLVNAIQVAGGYPTQEEAQWRTSAWVVRISVEGYPITFNLLTQRIDRQVAHLEAVAGVATQPGADSQVKAGQAPPEPTLAVQGATASVTPFLAPEDATGPLEAPAVAGREPFLAPEDSSSGSASASDNSTSPARDPDSGTTEECPDRQCPQRGRCSTLATQPEGENPTDQEKTPFLHPAYVGPFQQPLREYTSSEEEVPVPGEKPQKLPRL